MRSIAHLSSDYEYTTLVGPAGLLVQELALVLDDQDSLDVVGIPEFVDGAGVEYRLVEREADLLLSSDWPAPELCRDLTNSGYGR